MLQLADFSSTVCDREDALESIRNSHRKRSSVNLRERFGWWRLRLRGIGFSESLELLGFFRDGDDDLEESQALTSELEELLRQRDEARRSKNWGEADRLRDELAAAGVEVRDSPEGSKWSWRE